MKKLLFVFVLLFVAISANADQLPLSSGQTWSVTRSRINANDAELYFVKADKSNVIEKDSTEAFTPTADTHPTNKGYVDNAISEATTIDSSQFDGNLDINDNTIQKVANKVDVLQAGSGSGTIVADITDPTKAAEAVVSDVSKATATEKVADEPGFQYSFGGTGTETGGYGTKGPDTSSATIYLEKPPATPPQNGQIKVFQAPVSVDANGNIPAHIELPYVFQTPSSGSGGSSVTIQAGSPGEGDLSGFYIDTTLEIFLYRLAGVGNYSFGSYTFTADPSAPTVSGIELLSDGTTVEITCSENMESSTGGTSGVSLTVDSLPVTFTFDSIANNVISGTAGESIYSGSVITCDYAQPGNGFQAVSDGEDLASFTGVSVLNSGPANPGGLYDNITYYHNLNGKTDAQIALGSAAVFFGSNTTVDSSTPIVGSGSINSGNDAAGIQIPIASNVNLEGSRIGFWWRPEIDDTGYVIESVGGTERDIAVRIVSAGFSTITVYRYNTSQVYNLPSMTVGGSYFIEVALTPTGASLYIDNSLIGTNTNTGTPSDTDIRFGAGYHSSFDQIIMSSDSLTSLFPLRNDEGITQ